MPNIFKAFVIASNELLIQSSGLVFVLDLKTTMTGANDKIRARYR